MDNVHTSLICAEFEVRHRLMPNEGFEAAIPKVLAWLDQYEGMDLHIPWDSELPKVAVAHCLKTATHPSLVGTLRALSKLSFNEYVVFLRDETTEAAKLWNPLLLNLQSFDPKQAAWSYRGAEAVVSFHALCRFVDA